MYRKRTALWYELVEKKRIDTDPALLDDFDISLIRLSDDVPELLAVLSVPGSKQQLELAEIVDHLFHGLMHGDIPASLLGVMIQRHHEAILNKGPKGAFPFPRVSLNPRGSKP